MAGWLTYSQKQGNLGLWFKPYPEFTRYYAFLLLEPCSTWAQGNDLRLGLKWILACLSLPVTCAHHKNSKCKVQLAGRTGVWQARTEMQWLACRGSSCDDNHGKCFTFRAQKGTNKSYQVQHGTDWKQGPLQVYFNLIPHPESVQTFWFVSLLVHSFTISLDTSLPCYL